MDLSERRDGTGRHPWELARARFFRRLVADHVDVEAVRRVLDVGAGDAWFAAALHSDLPRAQPVVCWDVNYTVEDLQAGADDAGGAVTRTAIRPAGTFDLVLALDVLEHVVDDEAFLVDEILPAIGPGATAVISTPAHGWLFSEHDRVLHHVRRYAPDELIELVGRHLDVVASGSLFSSLVAPRAVGVLAERLGHRPGTAGVGSWQRGPLVTKAITSVLDADAAVGRRLARSGRRLPGLSVWVVATGRDRSARLV